MKKCELIRIKTKDGLFMDGLLWKPAKKTNKIYIHTHGYAGNFYENLYVRIWADKITDSNIAFLACNNRGAGYKQDFIEIKGGYKMIGGNKEKFSECIFDIDTTIKYAKSQGYKEIFLGGHSLAGYKVLYYILKNEIIIGKLILASVAGVRLVPKKYLTKIYNNLDKVKIPVLSFIGDNDQYFNKKEWAKFKDIPNYKSLILKGADHHYRNQEKKTANLIINWIRKK